MTLGNIRRATRADVPEIMAMVRELAEYERLADQAIATADQFEVALFGPSPAVYAFVVDDDPAAGTLAGFALYFLNFSTWLGVHGIYLEDLYVRPQFRGSGFGKRLLATLAQECVDKGYGRLDWWVLDWNTSSREFYEAQGAQALTEWIPYRVSGDRLPGLAGARD
jgi:GNAT superfamily N-acetyltransferase